MRATNLLPALLALTPDLATAKAKAKPKEAILLSEVQSLTLRANKQTTHRRVSAIPQLRCVSSPRVCALYDLDVMRCTNQGSSYTAEDVEWSCAASLPPELKLGSTDVVCEGYAGPDDPYVLRGSCGVEYRLVLTELGEQKYPDIANGGGWFSGWGGGRDSSTSSKRPNLDEKEGETGISGWLFSIVFISVVIWIVYSAWTQRPGGAGPQRRPRTGWFGGGGGGNDPGFGPGGGGGGGFGGYDEPPPPYSKYGRSNQEGWRPGFWSGMASGAAAAYMAGNRGRRQEQRGFFGGGSGSGSSWRSGPEPSSSSSRPSGSMSSSRYSSTGFGSTSRR
ncbi:DUF1183-domain-containing protein [Poronia punctata]|nr:DUF1183-domain-containing protein [Poronia punctata]